MHEEARCIVAEIKDRLLAHYKLQDIAIISKTKNQQQAMKDLIEQAGVPCVTVDRDNGNFMDESFNFVL